MEPEQQRRLRKRRPRPSLTSLTSLGPPDWPNADSQQLHLDFDVPDIDAAQAQVLALGATPLYLDDEGGTRGFRVYADPVGHPFCLCKG